MIEFLTSDPVIVVMTGVGLLATAVSIARDARAQRQRASVKDRPVTVPSEKIAA